MDLVEAYVNAGCNYYIAFIGDQADRGYPFSFTPDQYLNLTRQFANDVMTAFI